MATLLAIINDVQDAISLPRTTTAVGNSDATARQLLSLSRQIGIEMRDRMPWAQLQREFLLTLVSHSTTGDVTDNSANITNVANTTGIEIGDVVYGNGIALVGTQSNIVVTAISGSTVTMSAEAGSTNAGTDLVFSKQAYDLPHDFNQHINRTQWDRTKRWELEGPISPQEWQFRKSGIIASSVRRRYRVKGLETDKLFIDYPPAESDNGATLVFEYYSTNWVRPKTWVASTSFSAGSYCFYNGNYYTTTSGGTSGSTPPTQTSGSASDGGISWTYYGDPYENWLSDTDECNLPDEVLKLGIIWRFLMMKGLEYAKVEQQYERQLNIAATKLSGSRDLRLDGRPVEYLLSQRNIPDGNWQS